MERSRTARQEQRGEITFETLKRAAREGLHTYFTPVRAIFIAMRWGWRHIAEAMRGHPRNSAGKERGRDSPR